MKVISTGSIFSNRIVISLEHNGRAIEFNYDINVIGDGILESITDFIAHDGNFAAYITFKVDIKYRGKFWQRWRYITRCYKIVVDASTNNISIYIDGIKTTEYQCINSMSTP